MSSFFYRVYGWIRWLFGVVPRSAIKSSTLYLVIHYTIVTVVTLLLAYFSDRISDPEEWNLPYYFLRRFWWGIMFLLVYLFIRLVIYLIGLLRIHDEPEFEDIDRDWMAGMAGLQREGLDLRWLPAFIINGLTPEQERSVIQGSRLNWKVIAPPLEERSAVLRFFANDDAVFISCTGVGAMTWALRHRDVGAASAAPSPAATSEFAGTLRREDLQQARQAAAGGTLRSTPAPAASTGGGATLRSAHAVLADQTIMPGRHSQAPILSQPVAPAAARKLDHHEESLAKRRMQYFCFLLTRDRDPYCAANGMVQAAPISWSANQHELTKLCPAVALDLETVTHALELQMPVVLVFSEVEVLQGFGEFLERCGRIDPRFRDTRAGSRFPAGLPIDADNVRWAIERGLQWFRGWAYTAFAQDLQNPGNRKMYQFLCDLSDRRHRLEYQVKRAFEFRSPTSEPVRLSGCYFAATGQGTTHQGFLKGILLKLQSEQNEVAWSRQLLRRDAWARGWAWVLFMAALVMAAADAYLLWKIFGERSAG